MTGTTVGIRCTAGTATKHIDVKLTAWAARTTVTRRSPEVLPRAIGLAVESTDARHRHAGRDPKPHRFLIGRYPGFARPRRRPDLFDGQSEFLRHKVVREGYRFLLEVAPMVSRAESEVAQHLEEGVMGVIPHLLDIACPHALLDGDRPARGRTGWIKIEGLELLHPGTGQQDAWIALHDQGRTGCRKV